ncbi:PKD domain-containing protein [Cellulophaga sp. Z1A5H]|uniref:PKD domain-containing protein n=1 Tax=Cellulophaga sp. Z1A5H TaxID=2687291 RepID=UPI0013FDFF5D|nr:PKD domain-containing protein [Cellulophaga sp. Z1A5H]
MNLLKKGIFALLITGAIVSCEDDDTIVDPIESTSGTGLTEITFPEIPTSSVSASGDGTIITIRPQGLGIDSYVVDFGDLNSTSDIVTIIEDAGTASYDYPNDIAEGTYTITVTAKSDEGFPDVVQTINVTVVPGITAVLSAPDSPIILDENVYAIFSDGIVSDGAFIPYTNTISGSDFEDGDAEYNEVEVGDIKNKVTQYSKLHGTIAASISFNPAIVIADVFGTGASADYIHLDLHSVHDIGVDKVKITLGGKTFEQTLINDVWTGLDIDFASEGITQIDEITLELGASGTASNEATLNVDNIYLYRESLSVPEFTFDEVASDYDVTFANASELATSYSWDFGDGIGSSTEENPTYSYNDDGLEMTYMVTLTTTNFINKTTFITKEVTVGGASGPINPEIIHGDFNLDDSAMSNAWKIANTTGNSNPFGRSSDGSCAEYDGTDDGSKTRGAKWSSSQSANADGTAVAGDTRYAYQAITLSPNTDYIFEYEYAIVTGGAETNSVVASILNGHYSDSAEAVASNALVAHVGTESKGKFADNSCTGGTTMKLQFRSNSVGEVAIFIYAVTDKDAYVDNVKVYPAP